MLLKHPQKANDFILKGNIYGNCLPNNLSILGDFYEAVKDNEAL
jgi:hypothetical protein